MDYKDNILPYLEGLGYISNAGLLAVAIWGLKQITITKNTAKTNAKRDASKLASEQVKYYLEKIIPQVNKLDQEVRKRKMTLFKDSSFELTDDGIEVNLKARKEDEDQLHEIMGHITLTANMIEGFATFFTSKLADESIAFQSIGKTYCDVAEKYMPVIASIGGKDYYQNILKLYRLWKIRYDEQLIRAEKEKLEKKLQNSKNKEFIPIGVDE